MIYKLREQNILNENTLYLNASSVSKIKEYKFHILSGETKKHGPRIKIMFKSKSVACYRVDIHTGKITTISCDITPNCKSSVEDAVREVAYGCYKLLYKIAMDPIEADLKLMQYYTDLIISVQRYEMHSIAERIRVELNDKIS